MTEVFTHLASHSPARRCLVAQYTNCRPVRTSPSSHKSFTLSPIETRCHHVEQYRMSHPAAAPTAVTRDLVKSFLQNQLHDCSSPFVPQRLHDFAKSTKLGLPIIRSQSRFQGTVTCTAIQLVSADSTLWKNRNNWKLFNHLFPLQRQFHSELHYQLSLHVSIFLDWPYPTIP